MTEAQKLRDLEREFFRVLVKRNPDFATFLGIHKYDHLLPDESRGRYLEEIQLAREFLKKFRAIKKSRLSFDYALDRDLALRELRLSIFYLTRLGGWQKDPDAAEQIGDAILPLFARDFAPFHTRLDSIVSRLKATPALYRQTRGRISRPVRMWTEIAIESAEQLPSFFKEIEVEARRRKISRMRMVRLRAAIATTSEANAEHLRWLKNAVLPLAKKMKVPWAIGRKNFETLLRLREIEMPMGQIEKLGWRYLRETNKKLRRLAKEMVGREDTELAKRAIRAHRPKNFDEALATYREAMRAARAFVMERGLATVPKNERLIVMPTPIYLRHTHPFAAYFSPAKFDKRQLGIYIVTPASGKGLEKHNFAAIYNTSVHEAYPGHHLQLSCANKNPSLIRLLSHATEFVEGWAHFCEEYMKRLGFEDRTETRFVQTLDEAWRAARIIVDIGIHARGMSFDEAVSFLSKHMARPNAVAEVKRYASSPTYQLSYLLGKHLIKKMRADAEKRLGRAFSDRRFNDALLYAGSLPAKHMRRVLNEKLNA